MQADNKSYDDINVTPMVDLYLVLLLIFIIMTTAGVQGVKVNLPKASAAANSAIMTIMPAGEPLCSAACRRASAWARSRLASWVTVAGSLSPITLCSSAALSARARTLRSL